MVCYLWAVNHGSLSGVQRDLVNIYICNILSAAVAVMQHSDIYNKIYIAS